MKETESKKIKELEFMRQHTLSPAEFKRMIAEKMERARAYTKAQEGKREALLENR